MSKLKISENLFLEVAELNRLVKFLKKDGYEQIIKSLVKSYGIVNYEKEDFKVTAKIGSPNFVTINPGIAFDSQLRCIKSENYLDLYVENTGITRWIVLQYDTTPYEKGIVNITSDGTMQGLGTSFTEVLRGQPNFPTKVKFNSSLNEEEYEVVSVSGDTSAIISGSFIAESNLKYSVIGAFSPGFEAENENKNIYELDSYKITIIDSFSVPSLNDDQYILASIEFSEDGMLITDRRKGYMFNSSFSEGILPESDEIVSLSEVKIIQPNIIELSIEHGYSINSFRIEETSNSTIFKILSGNCNFWGTDNIPNGFFKKWILINKNTFKRVSIDNNINKDLYITKFNSEILVGDISEFIIVPPYSNLEYKISYSLNEVGNLMKTSYHLVTQGSNSNKLLISVPYGNVIIGLRYRMINGEESTPWQKFAIAEYVNENGNKQSIGDSQFTININEPSVKLRNYS